MNGITRKEYDAIKNDRNYTVVTYDPETNERYCTYSGLTVTQATNYIIEQQKAGRRTILLHDVGYVGVSRNMNDFEEAIQTSSSIKED
jgi:hypothetical protein